MKDNEREQPLVSFIIPVYNLPAEMVRECIESITSLSLSVGEREIIVVDDGSDISPLNGLADLSNDFIYIRQCNKGPAAARNKGIQMSAGKYIQFVDGDDKLIRTPYEHCLDIVRYRHPDMVLFDFVSYKENGDVLTSLKDKKKTDVPYEYSPPVTGSEYMRNNNLRASPWGYIFRKTILGSLRFDESLTSEEDEDFTPRLMLRSERLISTSAKAYCYIQRSGSLTKNDDGRHIDKRLNNTETIIDRLCVTLAALPDEDKPAMERRIAQLTMDYLYNTIRLKHDESILNQTIGRLKRKGLFPLPDKKYTRKYTYFRKCMNHGLTRKLMVRFL